MCTQLRMDVDGSPIAVDLWDSALELEGLGSVIKRINRNALYGWKSSFQADWPFSLYCLCLDYCVCFDSAIAGFCSVICTNSCSHSVIYQE